LILNNNNYEIDNMAKISSKSAAATEPQDSPEIEQEDTEILEDS